MESLQDKLKLFCSLLLSKAKEINMDTKELERILKRISNRILTSEQKDRACVLLDHYNSIIQHVFKYEQSIYFEYILMDFISEIPFYLEIDVFGVEDS